MPRQAPKPVKVEPKVSPSELVEGSTFWIGEAHDVKSDFWEEAKGKKLFRSL